jgi:hypothetical protein
MSSSLSDEHHTLLYRARLSSLYHRTIERYCETVDKCVKLGSLLLGSAAISSLISDDVKPYMVAVIAVSNGISLVFGIGERSRKHAEYAVEYGKLEAQIDAIPCNGFTASDRASLTSALVSLEAKEPLPFKYIVRRCQVRLSALYPSS